MNEWALWGCFFAIAFGIIALVRRNLAFYGGGRFLRTYFVLWTIVALAIGLFNMFKPEFRFPSLFLPASIISMTALLSLTLSRRADLARRASDADLTDWYGLQTMRAYFGACIVVGAALGYLPWAFAWTAGLGDIAVGLAAYALRHWQVRHRVAAWTFTLTGMADLINAGRLGAVLVTPWLEQRQMPGFLLALPLIAVPIMLANHIQTIRALVFDMRVQRLFVARR